MLTLLWVVQQHRKATGLIKFKYKTGHVRCLVPLTKERKALGQSGEGDGAGIVTGATAQAHTHAHTHKLTSPSVLDLVTLTLLPFCNTAPNILWAWFVSVSSKNWYRCTPRIRSVNGSYSKMSRFWTVLGQSLRKIRNGITGRNALPVQHYHPWVGPGQSLNPECWEITLQMHLTAMFIAFPKISQSWIFCCNLKSPTHDLHWDQTKCNRNLKPSKKVPNTAAIPVRMTKVNSPMTLTQKNQLANTPEKH